MRIVVFGQQAFGKDVFDSLVAAGEEVVGISTPKPREGRTDPLAEAAKEKDIPNVYTRELRKDEGFDEYLSWKPDLLVFAFVTDIVRQNVLGAATHGAIQYHPSLLPLHRGRAAMNWAIRRDPGKPGTNAWEWHRAWPASLPTGWARESFPACGAAISPIVHPCGNNL